MTLNLPLVADHDGCELVLAHGSGYHSVEMQVGRAIIHSGRHLHGVLPITEARAKPGLLPCGGGNKELFC